MLERWCAPLWLCTFAVVLCEDVFDLCAAGADAARVLLALAAAAIGGAWACAWALGRPW